MQLFFTLAIPPNVKFSTRLPMTQVVQQILNCNFVWYGQVLEIIAQSYSNFHIYYGIKSYEHLPNYNNISQWKLKLWIQNCCYWVSWVGEYIMLWPLSTLRGFSVLYHEGLLWLLSTLRGFRVLCYEGLLYQLLVLSGFSVLYHEGLLWQWLALTRFSVLYHGELLCPCLVEKSQILEIVGSEESQMPKSTNHDLVPFVPERCKYV